MGLNSICRTNLPKEVMGFPDLPMTEGGRTSFIKHDEVLRYLKRYADTYDLHKYIQVSSRFIFFHRQPMNKSTFKIRIFQLHFLHLRSKITAGPGKLDSLVCAQWLRCLHQKAGGHGFESHPSKLVGFFTSSWVQCPVLQYASGRAKSKIENILNKNTSLTTVKTLF